MEENPKFYYICSRGNQCSHKCQENCVYTGSFFKSKLYHNEIKPSKPIVFIKAKNGAWWEVNFDWDRNLPESLRSSPEEMVSYSYSQLENYEFSKAIRRAKITNEIPGVTFLR